ncbi:IS3 family transposase, partial [Brenneria tiliae]
CKAEVIWPTQRLYVPVNNVSYQAPLPPLRFSVWGVNYPARGGGCCYDNAVMESFYHTLKTELMQGKAFSSREQAMNALFDYIEVFYNRRRRHSTLGYQTPVDYEMAA